MNKDLDHKIKSIIHFNERIIGIKIETKQTDTFIIQIYMPTSSHKDEEIEELYQQISEVIEMAKEKDNLIILGLLPGHQLSQKNLPQIHLIVGKRLFCH